MVIKLIENLKGELNSRAELKRVLIILAFVLLACVMLFSLKITGLVTYNYDQSCVEDADCWNISNQSYCLNGTCVEDVEEMENFSLDNINLTINETNLTLENLTLENLTLDNLTLENETNITIEEENETLENETNQTIIVSTSILKKNQLSHDIGKQIVWHLEVQGDYNNARSLIPVDATILNETNETNNTFVFDYETPKIEIEEQEYELKKGAVQGEQVLLKTVKIRSEFSGHYENILVTTTLNIQKERGRLNDIKDIYLYHLIDDVRVDVTSDSDYDVMIGVDDVNSTENFTSYQVSWQVPRLSEQIFELKLGGRGDEEPRMSATDLSACENLTIENEVYTMTANVSSTGTCMNVSASNVTLDCNGFTINYSSSSVGYGVYTNSSYTTVKNCVVNQTNASVGNSAHAIYFNGVSNGTVFNNSVTTISDSSSYGLRFSSSLNNNVTSNNITTFGNAGTGIVLISSSNNTFSSNNIVLSNGYGIQTISSSNNNITNNKIVTKVYSGIRLDASSNNNSVTSNNITLSAGGGYGVNHGVYIISSSNNILVSNNVTTTDGVGAYGFYSSSSTNSALTGNQFNTLQAVGVYVTGTTVAHYNQSIDTSNLAEGLPIWYNYSVSNTTILQNTNVSGTIGQLICAWCSNVTYDNVTMGNDGFTFLNTSNSKINNSVVNTNNGYGVFAYGSSSAYLQNNTFNLMDITTTTNSYLYGIYLLSASGNNVTNCNVSTSGANGYGVYLLTSTYNNLTSNNVSTTGTTSHVVLLSTNANYNNLIGNEVLSANNDAYGIALSACSSNSLVDNKVTTLSFSATIGVSFSGGSGNNLTSSNIKTSGSIVSYGLYFSGGSVNNLIKDTFINASYSGMADVSSTGTSGINNFTNCTFNKSDTSITSTGSINVFWYADTYVNDTLGNNVSGANVSEYTTTGTLANWTLTNSSGWTSRVTLREYMQNATAMYYDTNYSFNATHPFGGSNSASVNLTGNKIIDLSNYVYVTVSTSNITSCMNITDGNAVYVLTSNVSSAGTCMNITASNVTLDCNGYTINFHSSSAVGYGVYTNSSYTTVKNCVISPGGSYCSSCQGVYLDGTSGFGTFFNNSITSLWNSGFYIMSSSNLITSNRISAPYSGGNGISTWSGISNNNITSNNISTDGAGVKFYYSGASNNISNNNIISGDWGIKSQATNGNIFMGNNITSSTGGISLYSSSNNNIVNNNNVTTTGSGAHAFYSSSSTNSTLTNNRFNTTSAVGVYVTGTTSSHYNQSIDTSNLAEGLPIWYNYSVSDTAILENTNVSGTIGQLICVWCTNVTYNNVTMGNDGFSLYGSNSSIISYSNVSTSKGYPVFVYGGYFNNVSYGNFTTTGTAILPAITLSSSSNNTVMNNYVATSGTGTAIVAGAYGVYLTTSSIYNNVTNNNVTTSGSYGFGFYLYSYSSYNNITSNIIKTSGTSAHGVMLYTYPNNNVFANNNITASAYGIWLQQAGSNVVSNNNITSGSYGIFAAAGSSNNITNNIFRSGSLGIYLQSASNNNILIGNNILTTLNGANGVYLHTSTGNIFKDSVINATFAGTADIFNHGDGIINNFTNCTFNKADTGFSATSASMNVFWYADTYIKDTVGSGIPHVNVSFYNSLGALAYSALTGNGTELPNYGAYSSRYGINMSGNVLLMHMNEASGDITDYSDIGNNGTNNGASYNATGVVNTSALNFDGSSSYVNVGNKQDFNFDTNQDFSIGFWFKTSKTSTQGIMGKKQAYGAYAGWMIGMAYTGTGNNGYPIFQYSNGVGYTNYEVSTNYANGLWHYMIVTVSRDGSVADGIWVDDIKKIADISNSNSTNLSSSLNMFIGKLSEKFNGSIDEVAIWNRTLSATEVSAIYNVTQGAHAGIATRQTILEYMQNATGMFYQTNYTVNASKINYNSSSQEVNLTDNRVWINNYYEGNPIIFTLWDTLNPIPLHGTNPADNYNSSISNVTLDFRCYDDTGISIMQMWNNLTGTWHENYTNSSSLGYTNNTWINLSYNLSDAMYQWGIWCNDTGSLENWSVNRTFTVDTTYPRLQFEEPTPANDSGASGSFILNLTVSDVNLERFIYNWNGTNTTYYRNYSNLTNNGEGNWTLIINQTGLTVGQTYTYYVVVRDFAGNVNSTETRQVRGNSKPQFVFVNYTPSTLAQLDPGVFMNITANISDADSNFDRAIFQWKNASQNWSDATNLTMNNLTNKGRYTTENVGFTLPDYDANITVRIVAIDFVNDSNSSTVYHINSSWDCTWNITTSTGTETSLGATAGFNEKKPVGSILIGNTGDYNFTNHCTLLFKIKHNLQTGKICFSGQTSGECNADNYKDYSAIAVNETLNITVNYTFISTLFQESYVLNISERSVISENYSKNVNGTAISNSQGPYLYQEVDSYPAFVYIGNEEFNLSSYVQNLMGSSTYNETNAAFNVTSNLTLDSRFTNYSGNLTNTYENASDSSIRSSDLEIGFTSALTMTPGVHTFILTSSGFNISGDPIKDANNNTLLNTSVSISFLCDTIPDGYVAMGCWPSDPDTVYCGNSKIDTGETCLSCPEDLGACGTSDTGGSGGGGLSGGQAQKIFQTSERYELLRGKDNKFIITVENPFAGATLENVTMKVSGFLAQYLLISPEVIDSIPVNGSRNFTIKITAPNYFQIGSYNLTFYINGIVKVNNSVSLFSEKRKVSLDIHDVSRKEAFEFLNKSRDIIQEMNQSKFYVGSLIPLYDQEQSAFKKYLYESVRDIYEKIKDLRDKAYDIDKRVKSLSRDMIDVNRDGIQTPETLRLLSLTQVAFSRGDYDTAMSRIKEAELSYAIETKGEFSLTRFLKKNWLTLLIVLAALVLLAYIIYLWTKYALIKQGIARNLKEERILIGLMKTVQKDCFELGKMAMGEYGDAMQQYELKLNKTTQNLIELETKKAHFFRFRSEDKRLGIERQRLLENLKETQKLYFERGKLETRIYETKLRSYAGRLSDVEEKLALIEAQKALRRHRVLSKKNFKKIRVLRVPELKKRGEK